jgi:hypothetical protein
VFEIAQKRLLYAQFDWSEGVSDIYAGNRRLLNLLRRRACIRTNV